jgi:hypothetical protein
MVDWKNVKEEREQQRYKEAYRREMRYFAEDIFGEPAPEPEQQTYDASKPADDKQNFMLGLLGPSIDAARVMKAQRDGTTVDSAQMQAELQAEQDAFEEQQALEQEKRLELDIRGGLYKHTELGQMTQAQRQEMYRRAAIDREQARYERDYAAKQRAKRRQKEREADAKRWEQEDRYGL